MRLIVLGGTLVLGTSVLGPCSKSDGNASPAPSASAASAAPNATASTPAAAASHAGAACSVVGSFKGHPNTAHGSGTSELKAGSDGSFSMAITLDANKATTTLGGTYTTSGNEITVVNTSGTASNGA